MLSGHKGRAQQGESKELHCSGTLLRVQRYLDNRTECNKMRERIHAARRLLPVGGRMTLLKSVVIMGDTGYRICKR